MELFRELDIETGSFCNMACATCLRQSYKGHGPQSVQGGRGSASGGHGRAVNEQMDQELVCSILDQAASMGFDGAVCLQHFNEPLADDRLAEFAAYAKSLGQFRLVYVNTNGDYLSRVLAKELDGRLDQIHVSLYGPLKDERYRLYSSWFKRTRVTAHNGQHLVTHFSPFRNLAVEIEACQDQPCMREAQHRAIITYTGEMAMCCDDVACRFGLGSVQEVGLYELWYGSPHREIVGTLSRPGGRQFYPYCRICPRHNTPMPEMGRTVKERPAAKAGEGRGECLSVFA